MAKLTRAHLNIETKLTGAQLNVETKFEKLSSGRKKTKKNKKDKKGDSRSIFKIYINVIPTRVAHHVTHSTPVPLIRNERQSTRNK